VALHCSLTVWCAAAGAISSATVTPASLVAVVKGDAVLAFTTASALPSDGKIVVTFPSGFDLTTVASGATSVTGIDGALATTVNGQIVTITRSGGASFPAGAITDLTLKNVGNPAAGATGTFTITTTSSADAAIDTLTTVPVVTIEADSPTPCECAKTWSHHNTDFHGCTKTKYDEDGKGPWCFTAGVCPTGTKATEEGDTRTFITGCSAE